MALAPHSQFTTVKQEQGMMVKDIETGTAVGTTVATSNAVPYEKTTTYASTTHPVVNPRTGDVTTVTETAPLQQVTTVEQPIVYETTSHTSYTTGVPVTTAVTDAQEIRYHDY